MVRLAGAALLTLAVAVAGAYAVGAASPPPGLDAGDFFEYKAAAGVLARGGDMYDGRSLLELQVPGGWADPKSPPESPRAQMMWNPPWVAPLILPFARPDWGPGCWAWAAVQAWLVAASAMLLWRVYGADAGMGARGYALALAVAAAFPPDYWLVTMGQISGYALFGLAGFVAGMRAGRPALAGAALALTAVKPHLLLPFAALLAAAALAGDRATRRAVLAGGVLLALAAISPLLLRPGVWGEYLAATAAPTDEFHFSPSNWNPPILAGWLRRALGLPVAAQFAPSLLATAGLLAYWWPRRRRWDWPRETPAVVLVCFLTTGYGAWLFDLAVLLVPVTLAAARLAGAPSRLAGLVAAVALGAFGLLVNGGVYPKVLWTPTIALGCWAAGRLGLGEQGAPAP